MKLIMLVIIHEALCAALLYTVFCRAVQTCERVRADVRLAFLLLGLVACMGMAWPLAWGLVHNAFGLALLAAIVVVQFVTAQHWEKGVPDKFYKPGQAPRQRRACDTAGGCRKKGA